MKYHIEKTSKKTAYLQLYEQIRSDILTSVYPFGSRLPSKRILCAETGASVITVEHAYALLCDEGYIASKERSGYYVIYRSGDFLSVPETNGRSTVRTVSSHGISGVVSFPLIAKTMRKVLSERGEDILVKSDNVGCQDLRNAVAAYLARSQGIIVKASQIVVGSGSEYLYSLIAQLLNGRKFALEDPSYEKIRQVYNACGTECDMLGLSTDGIKSSELARTNATVLHVTPFNSFPSGITASVSKRMEYINWAKKCGGIIIEDNYDSELTVSLKNEDTVFSLSREQNVIYLNTFSRTVAPSFRVGYMVLPENMAGQFEEKLGFYSCTVPVFEQYVLTELIENGDFERHINRVRRAKRRASEL